MKSKIFTQLPARDEASSGVHRWRRSSRAERQAERYEQGIDQRRLVAQTNGDYTDTDQEELGQPGGGKLGQQKGDQNRQKQRYSLQGVADKVKTRRFLNLMVVALVLAMVSLLVRVRVVVLLTVLLMLQLLLRCLMLLFPLLALLMLLLMLLLLFPLLLLVGCRRP